MLIQVDIEISLPGRGPSKVELIIFMSYFNFNTYILFFLVILVLIDLNFKFNQCPSNFMVSDYSIVCKESQYNLLKLI